jgi:DNA-binding MarR family transcriptional regulator
MANPKARWNRDDNMNKLLHLLKEHTELTFKDLKNGLQVSDPTLTEYVKLLEQQNKIEHFDKPGDRRSQWYRIKQESETEVQTQLGKYEAVRFIKSIYNPIYSYHPSEHGKSIAAFCGALDTVNRKQQQKMVDAIVNHIPLGWLKLPKPSQKMAVVIMVEGEPKKP